MPAPSIQPPLRRRSIPSPAPWMLRVLAIPLIAFPSASAVTTQLKKNAGGKHVFVQGGREFVLHGAGGDTHLDVLKASGGNAIRTWGIESLDEKVDGKPLPERARELGIHIVAGIWVGHERHNFNYSDPKQIARQRKSVREAVARWKHEPAIVVWGLGNEMEGPVSDGSNPLVWRELEELAKIVKAEDPTRPVMTALAGVGTGKIAAIRQHYPSLDILGINAYAAAPGVARAVVGQGWTKPFMLTEFGPTGHWEVSKTAWGAPVEPSSRDKAGTYFATYSTAQEEGRGACIGTFAFVWGQKQETTSTWYGMFLPSGEKLPQVDAMARAWTGAWPENRCPRVETFRSAAAQAEVAAGGDIEVEFLAKDPNGDPLSMDWRVAEESRDTKIGGDREAAPPEKQVRPEPAGPDRWRFKAPDKPGPYRLFVFVRDGRGAASAENFPFLVKASPAP